jgi:hypothetical protein
MAVGILNENLHLAGVAIFAILISLIALRKERLYLRWRRSKLEQPGNQDIKLIKEDPLDSSSVHDLPDFESVLNFTCDLDSGPLFPSPLWHSVNNALV